MNSRKLNISEFDLCPTGVKESKIPRKIFTFTSENLKKIEADKNAVIFECEITKIAEKSNQKRFFRFINNAILYSKAKEFIVSKIVLFETGLQSQIKYDEKNEIKSIIFINQGKKFEFFCSDKSSMETIKKILKKKLMLAGFHDEFRAIKIIGKGSSATVYLCQNNIENKQYATKAISKAFILDKEKNFDLIYNEIALMRKVSHSNLINLDSVYETENSFYMVLELFQGGNLKSLISKHGALSTANCTIVMRAMLNALMHLKQHNILHRDIKPENILFRNLVNVSGKIREEDIVLADFGFAVSTFDFPFHHPRCGTPGYVAPEILSMRNKNSSYGYACDVFSLGITFFHALCGRLPYDAKNCKDLLDRNEECKFLLDQKNFRNNPIARELITEMIERRPTERITVECALSHDFFAHPYDLSDSEAECTLHEIMKNFNSKRKVSLEQINPLSGSQNSPPNSATKKPSIDLTGSIRKRKFTEDEEEGQNSLSLAINKPILNGFLKTYLSITQAGDYMEDRPRGKMSFSPIFVENEEYEGKFDEIRGN